MTLKELLKATKGRIISGDSMNRVVGKICIDSSLIDKNDVFIVMNENSIDSFVINRASVIITNKKIRFKDSIPVIFVRNVFRAIVMIGRYNRNKFIDKPLICITGSIGKSNMCNLLYSVLKSQYSVLVSDSCDLIGISILLSQISEKYDIIICSCGINGYCSISKISKIIRPTTCIITNILTNHICDFDTQDNIFKEKLGIVSGMRYGNLIVNGSDFYLNRIKFSRKYSVIKTNEDNVDDVVFNDRLCFKICLDGRFYSISFCCSDKCFIDYILLTISCSSLFCISNHNIVRGINSFVF